MTSPVCEFSKGDLVRYKTKTPSWSAAYSAEELVVNSVAYDVKQNVFNVSVYYKSMRISQTCKEHDLCPSELKYSPEQQGDTDDDI